MIHFDEKFWLAIAFFTLIGLLVKKAGPFISNALGNKAQAIAKDLKDAQELKAKAEQLLAESEKFSAESKAFAEKLLKDAETEAEKIATTAKKQIEEEITKKTAATIERIKIEEEAAIRELKEKIITTAITNLSQSLPNKLTKEHQDHLLETANNNLEKA